MLGTIEIQSVARVSVVFKTIKGAINLNELNPFKLILGDIHGDSFYEEQWTTAATTTNTVTLTFGTRTLFIPSAIYKITVMCTQNGGWVEFGNTTFLGPAGIAPPLTAITPRSPSIRNQKSFGNCVAMSIATAMDVLKMKSYGSEFENYSASYIYGNGAGLPNEQGMFMSTAIDNCMSQGSPRVDLPNVKASIPLDTMSVSESVTLHNNAPTYAQQNALKQKIVAPEFFDFYNGALLHNYLTTYGVILISFEAINSFYYLSGPSSILPTPNGNPIMIHAAAIIGATVISGKLHWIVQNSWGSSWGDGGKFYIPWDYAAGTTYTATWGIYDALKVTNPNISNTHPAEISTVTGTKVSATQATITWTSSHPAGTYYLVFASKAGTNEYYLKGRTTSKSLLITLNDERLYDIKVIAEDSSYRYSKGKFAQYQHGVGFMWNYPVEIGSEIKIEASQWNSLRTLIYNEYIKYFSSYGFGMPIVVQNEIIEDNDIYYAILNTGYVAEELGYITWPYPELATVSGNSPIKASHFKTIADYYNLIR